MAGHSMAPDDATLRELRREGLSTTAIAARYGVTRQTASNWLRKAKLPARISRIPRHEAGSRKYMLPWDVKGADHNDQIAKALRAYDKHRKGEPVDQREMNQIARLLAFLGEHNVVVDYNREEGFMFRPRTPGLDADDDIIRRPPEE